MFASREAVLALLALAACGGRTTLDSGWDGQAGSVAGRASQGGMFATAGAPGISAGAPAAGAPAAGAPAAQGGQASAGLANGGGAGESPANWRQSPNPLCSGLPSFPGQHSIWSDGNAVYFAGADLASNGLLYTNGGFGWSERMFPMREFQGVTGLRGDTRLFLQQNSTGCGIALLSNASIECSAPPRVDQAQVVSSTLAFALAEGGQVIRYDGSYWMQIGARLDQGSGAQLPHGSIWGTEKYLFVTSTAGNLYRFDNSADSTALDRREKAPPLTYTSVFGFSESDVWAGTTAGTLAHFDGNVWTRAAAVPGCGGVQALWGANGTLYAISQSAFVRIAGGKVTNLDSRDCAGAQWVSLWGDSEKEVYLVENDVSLAGSACGSTRLFWFDGLRLGEL